MHCWAGSTTTSSRDRVACTDGAGLPRPRSARRTVNPAGMAHAVHSERGGASMHSDYDPDDNFAHAFGADADIDDEAAIEALVWQLLLLINPGDEDAAAAQLAAWQQSGAGHGGDVEEAVAHLREAIDWRSGFHVEEGDARGLVESLDELAARWNLRIDWGVEDPTDDDFLDGADLGALIGTAYDRLREHHYTLWLREAGPDLHAGWITHSRDDEALRLVATALGIHVRHGAG